MSVSLEFRGVSKLYNRSDLPAVSSIDLRLDAGETLALIGESGGGKSTLLRLASGLETPDAGEILLGEQVVASKRAWVPPEKRNVGLVFQDGALFPHLNVAENLGYGLVHLDRSKRDQSIARYLAKVGLSGKEKRYPHELSGGERQRLAVARALAPEPGIVLMDEPFGSLDPALRRTLRDEIHDLLRSVGATVVLVTHDPEDALSIADKIAVLKQGSIQQFGIPEEVYDRPVSAYCAHLFGPANEVVLQDRSRTWIRPDRFTLHNEPRASASPARVQQVRNIWKHTELKLSPTNHLSPGPWLAYDSPQSLRKIGDTVWVEIKER